ncbi:MAG: tRNA (adenosine(37)-N6)-threonylcarbamoyltransferase complex dimerization subunit type 1 TsaB [Myxococcota bacterium]
MSAPVFLCADSGSTRLVVAAVRGDEVHQAESESQAAHGVAILELVSRVSAEAGVSEGGYDALVVALGPGSFTGLRTSLSTFKGLAMGWGKPLIGVPTMNALLHSAGASSGERVACCLDARKGEVYGAIFERANAIGDERELVPPSVMPPAEFAKVAAPHAPKVWAGDGMARFPEHFGALVAQGRVGWPHAPPKMSALAACALLRFPHGDDLATLEPTYVRRTAAQLCLGA